MNIENHIIWQCYRNTEIIHFLQLVASKLQINFENNFVFHFFSQNKNH